MMKSILSAIAGLAMAAALALAPAPAKAQVMNNSDTIVIQLGGVTGQVAGAVADAYSAANEATAEATAANLVNASDLNIEMDTTSYHALGYGAVDNDTGTIVGQLGLVGAQTASSSAKAAAQLASNAKAVAANIVNSSGIIVKVNVATSRH